MTHIETCNTQEGSDELKQFLLDHNNKLKDGVSPIYQVLVNEDIDFEELIEFAEVDLRRILNENNEIKLKSKQIGRLINVLRSTAESTICKTAKKEKVVIILSEEEHNALNSIKKKSVQIKQYKQKITNTLSILTQNKVQSKNDIETQIKSIIEAAQERQKQLMVELDKIVEDKTAKLDQQLSDLENNELKVNECLESIRRKTSILRNARSLLSAKDVASYDDFTVAAVSDIYIQIDTKAAMDAIEVCGNIASGKVSVPNPPPIITLKYTDACTAQVNIQTVVKDIIGYKLRFAVKEDNKQDTEDMKTEWKDIKVNKSNNNLNYNIKSLKPLTNYILYAFCKSTEGFGQRSKALVFRTKQLPSFTFDVYTKGMNKVIQNNGRAFSTTNINVAHYINAADSVGMKSRICILKLESDNLAFGITSDMNNCRTKHWLHDYHEGRTYFARHTGKAYVAGAQSSSFKHNGWKQGDIVKMQWSDSGLLTWYTNNIKIGEMEIETGLLYHPCVCTISNGQNYLIL